jgi:hypothetical protein
MLRFASEMGVNHFFELVLTCSRISLALYSQALLIHLVHRQSFINSLSHTNGVANCSCGGESYGENNES